MSDEYAQKSHVAYTESAALKPKYARFHAKCEIRFGIMDPARPIGDRVRSLKLWR